MLCFGGFLLQWMSYTALFAVTAVLSVLLFLVANKYMSKYTSDNEEENCETEDTHMNIVQFIFRPRIISFFLPDDDSASDLWIFPELYVSYCWF